MKNKTLVMLTLLSAVSFASFAQTQIIAHRGVWKNTNLPQNSIASLNAAVEQKLWGSEFDVHLTKDDVLVINHDNDFYGIDIATSTYEELLTKKHPNGEKIPTLTEYLKEGLKQKDVKLVLELKTNKLGTERTLKAADLAIATVKELKAKNAVEYIAFSYDACVRLRELDKKAKIHYLNGDKSPKELKDAKFDGFDYNLSVLKKHPTWIKEAKDLKLKTNVWTVNTEADMIFFLGENVDYITTDQPELLRTVKEKN